MYAFAIAVYMLLNVKQIYDRLSSIEGGFAAFTKLEWVMAVLGVLMVPMAALMLIKVYKDARRSIEEKKQEAEQAEQEKQQRKQQEYYDDDPAESEAEEVLRQAAVVTAKKPAQEDDDNKSVFDS